MLGKDGVTFDDRLNRQRLVRVHRWLGAQAGQVILLVLQRVDKLVRESHSDARGWRVLRPEEVNSFVLFIVCPDHLVRDQRLNHVQLIMTRIEQPQEHQHLLARQAFVLGIGPLDRFTQAVVQRIPVQEIDGHRRHW